jgi:hypothetical protein
MNNENRARRVTHDALGCAAQSEMFQSGPPTRRRDDEIDSQFTREPADFLEGPAFARMHIFTPDDGRFPFRRALEMGSNPAFHFNLGHDEWQRRHTRERIIGGKDVHEVQLRLKFFDERTGKSERCAGRRGEIDRDKHSADREFRRAIAPAVRRRSESAEFLLHHPK